jgi:hypothetical protein
MRRSTSLLLKTTTCLALSVRVCRRNPCRDDFHTTCRWLYQIHQIRDCRNDGGIASLHSPLLVKLNENGEHWFYCAPKSTALQNLTKLKCSKYLLNYRRSTFKTHNINCRWISTPSWKQRWIPSTHWNNSYVVPREDKGANKCADEHLTSSLDFLVYVFGSITYFGGGDIHPGRVASLGIITRLI